METIGKNMESNKIAIIYTTFLRNKLSLETIQSIQPYLSEKMILLIGDQNKVGQGINHKYTNCKHTIYYELPFDCGLSYGRNYLVQIAQKMGIKYCLLTADSIKFTEKYNFDPIINFLEEKEERGIVGFELLDRQYWVYNIDLIPGLFFKLTKNNLKVVNNQEIQFTGCEVITNFFLAKTKCLIDNKWDNELKLAEHEDFFWRLKQTKYKVFWTNYIKAQYINQKNTEYNKYRRRLYYEFKQKLQQKYSITGWLQYEKR